MEKAAGEICKVSQISFQEYHKIWKSYDEDTKVVEQGIIALGELGFALGVEVANDMWIC